MQEMLCVTPGHDQSFRVIGGALFNTLSGAGAFVKASRVLVNSPDGL
jgi:hypothetical protein